MTSIAKVPNFLSQNAELLAKEIVDSVIDNMKIEISRQEKEEAVKMYLEFFTFFGNSLLIEDINAIPPSILEWSKKNASAQVSLEGKISVIVVRYPVTRELLTDILTRISMEFELSLIENASMIKRMNALLDISLNETIYAYESLTDQYKEETQRELAQLSAPIVPVKDGIVVLPIIGEIDCDRAEYITENVIPEISQLGVELVIVDVSGTLTINEENARYLHQINNMLRLMGIKVLVTGIRPELALITVNSRVHLSELQTFATVKQALESLDN